MRNSLILMFLTVFQLFANESYSQDTRLTLNLDDVTVQKVLDEIETQSEFFFLCNKNLVDIERKISINKVDETIEEILPAVFYGTNVDYVVLDRQIVLSPGKFLKEVKTKLQPRTVTGQVVDTEGVPQIGVTITVKGTQIGVITDRDGYYSFELPEGAQTLVFSSMGMKNQEIEVGNQTTINVTMETDVIGLDELVVIGYGRTKKSDLTGSVERVNKAVFATQAGTQIADMLAGTVAGLNVLQSTNADGSAAFEVRGPTSLSGATNPLLVVDGSIFHGDMGDINPNDVESIDVLKDASAAAVYGAKAASGVIIITTTKGREGRPTINFSTKIGLTSVTNNSFKPHGPGDYEEFRKNFFRSVNDVEQLYEDYYWDNPNSLPSGVTIDQWRSANPNPNADDTEEYMSRLNFFEVEKEQYRNGETTDWWDEMMQTGVRQEYDLSIGGGSKDYHYYWSIGHVNNEGIIVGDGFSSLRSRLNVDFNVTDWLKVGVNTQFANRDMTSTPASLADARLASPYGRIYDDDGSIRFDAHGLEFGKNPMLNPLTQKQDYKGTTVFATMFAEVALPLGIKYKLSYQPHLRFNHEFNYWGTDSWVGAMDHDKGYGERNEYSSYNYLVDNILTWNKEIDIHHFDVTLLYNFENFTSSYSMNSSENFVPNGDLGYHALQFGTKPNIATEDTEAGGNALMGRLNYTLSNKYLVTLSARRDGYSAFGQENPTAIFPAAAVAWKLSEEDFFNVDAINRVKLRVSWGVNGNRDIGMYSALAQIGSTYYYDGSNVQVGLFNSSLSNPGLRWERTQSLNFGLNMGLYNDRIDVSVDYYDMTTTDLLMERLLPEITGFKRITTNLGELANKGVEITLNTVNMSSENFAWRSGLTYSANRNEIVSLFGDVDEEGNELPDYSNEWFPGHAIDAVWEYDVTGIWQTDEAAEAAEKGFLPGDFKAEDVNGDDLYTIADDKQFVGNSTPQHRIGFRNEFTFLKNFSAMIFIRADLGHLGDFSEYGTHSGNYDRHNIYNVPYWTKENGNNEFAKLTENRGPYEGGLRFYKSRSFVRVQDISLSYNLPASVAQRIGLQGVKVFVSGRNLLTFTKWPGFDPESGFEAGSNYMPLADLSAVMPKTITFGLNVSL
ncbi:MAG: SusC/RagA family TonB-linked outer membrane protein [Bacteroidota bacterium]